MSTKTKHEPRQDDDVILLDPEIDRVSTALDRLAANYVVAIDDPSIGTLKRAMLIAQGIERLKAAITEPFMRHVMGLMDTPLGFKSDRAASNKGPYSMPEVKNVFVASLLAGLYPYNNEWNIISGNLYIAQNGYRRKVKEFPGLTDLVLSPGIPVAHNGQVCVRFGARWKLNGVPQQLLDAEGKPGRTFAIISYEKSSPDNIVGKAIRKGLKAIYDQVTGSESSGEMDDGEIRDVPAAVADGKPANGMHAPDLTDKLKQKAAEVAAPPPREVGDEPAEEEAAAAGGRQS